MKTKNSLKLILSTFAIVLSLAFTLCAGASIFKSDTLPNSQEFEASAFGISAVGSKQLTVVARGAKDGEDQVFRYRVTGKSATDFIDFEVLIVGNGSVTIKNMPTGHYVVTEILDSTWRYETVAISRKVNLSASLAGAAVFDHERTSNKWLNEFGDVVTI